MTDFSDIVGYGDAAILKRIGGYVKHIRIAKGTSRRGKWRLVPAYDICHAYRLGSEWVSQHNLSINGKRKDISVDDMLAVARQNSIRDPKAIIDEVSGAVRNWARYAELYSVEPGLASAIGATLH